MNDTHLQEHLKIYLATVKQAIDSGLRVAGFTLNISDEKDLERFVLGRVAGDETLLKILGYTETSVDDHPARRTIIGRSQYVPLCFANPA
jgi:hypothetical protein